MDEIKELNEIGAKSMGWVYLQSINEDIADSWCTTKDNIHFHFVMYAENWTPATDIGQAFMVLDTFDHWDMYKMPGRGREGRKYTCKIWMLGGLYQIGQSDEMAKAIMLAVRETTK